MASQAGSILGVVAGGLGILYGLKAKYFRADFFGLSAKPAEKVAPRWQDRVLVVSISAIVLIASLVALFTHR